MKTFASVTAVSLILVTAIFALASCNAGSAFSSTQSSTADTVFRNGAIYTVNADNPWAEAVAIRNGEFVYVGNDAGVDAFISNSTEVIDLEGLMLMPGFQDPHLHAVEAGINESLCLLSRTASASAYERELADCAQQQSSSDWVRGAGASVSDLLMLSEDPLEIIDRAIPDRPALFLDDLGHGAWANTLALEAVGYDNLIEQPQGGVVVIDQVTRQLTGVVLENAQQQLRTAAFEPNVENLELAYQGLLNSLKILAQNGITSVSDAGGYWPRGHHEVWQRALREQTLTVRASNALYVFPDRPFDEQISELGTLYSNDSNSLLRFNQAKIYVDGILDLSTSALYQPYDFSLGLQGIDSDGFLYFEPQTLTRYASELNDRGFQLHFHATGDRATGLALDAIETAISSNNSSNQRHRITHLSLVDERDRQRFNDLGVIADFQLASGSIDLGYADDIAELIGGRADQLLPAASLLNAGARVVLSSDWDADELSPFAKIEAVLTRDVEGISNLETVIRMMTLDVAYLLQQDTITGSIEVGKKADLIVLDQNLFEISTTQISNNFVLLTMLNGNVVYQDPLF